MIKSKQTKKQKNAEFLKKIGTLSFSVGGKSYPAASKKPKLKLMGVGYFGTITRHPRTPEERIENEQQAFGE